MIDIQDMAMKKINDKLLIAISDDVLEITKEWLISNFDIVNQKGIKEIDSYKLPPVLYIKECSIAWVLAQATSKKHRKYLSASIILGQPFNRRMIISQELAKIETALNAGELSHD